MPSSCDVTTRSNMTSSNTEEMKDQWIWLFEIIMKYYLTDHITCRFVFGFVVFCSCVDVFRYIHSYSFKLLHWRWYRLRTVPHIYMRESIGLTLVQIMACRLMGPSHYPNQCWVIVYWILGNKLQWNFIQNTRLFNHQNASENIIWRTFCPGGGGTS